MNDLHHTPINNVKVLIIIYLLKFEGFRGKPAIFMFQT